MSVADRTFLVRDQPYYIVRSHYLVCDSSFASPCVAEIIAVTAFFISGLRFLQSEMSLRSSSEKSFVRRLSQKNSATEIPKAAQQLSIVETVGLLPRFIMLEIVDWDTSASFASWYFDHPRSSRSSEIRTIKSLSFTTSLHYNFIPKLRSSIRTNRLYSITVHLRIIRYKV